MKIDSWSMARWEHGAMSVPAAAPRTNRAAGAWVVHELAAASRENLCKNQKTCYRSSGAFETGRFTERARRGEWMVRGSHS